MKLTIATTLTAGQRIYAVVFGVREELPAVPETIWQVVATLTPREEIVLQLRFGRFGYCNTLEAIGTVLGVNRERIRQIEAKALRKLRHPTRSRIITAMTQGQDWSMHDINKADFFPYWQLRIKQATAQGMKSYAARCLRQFVYHLENTRDYRRPEDITEDDLLHKRGIGPVTIREIKHFLPIENKPIDFTRIPRFKEVEALYEEYQKLPLGKARTEFWAKHPDLDAWGKKVGIWK